MQTDNEYEGFCILCGHQIASFDGLKQCPNCGSMVIPCDYLNQRTISINLHELKCLCIWAESYAYDALKGMESSELGNSKLFDQIKLLPDVVYGIAARIRRQLQQQSGVDDVSLTMADEFKRLKEGGYKFMTNHPAARNLP